MQRFLCLGLLFTSFACAKAQPPMVLQKKIRYEVEVESATAIKAEGDIHRQR
jgi:hypothetical protein